MHEIEALSRDIAACRLCRDAPEGVALPHEPNPVAVLSKTATVCLAGQAPGMRVHRSGRPFTDPSGDRLRDWMGIDETVFYDASKLAIVPMGFCFPGYDAKGGDLPPRRECRAQWHDRVFDAMGQIELVLVIGRYAQAYHMANRRRATLTQTVAAWRDHIGSPVGGRIVIPLPHPSWRNNGWLKRNPWFEVEFLPELRKIIAQHLDK